MEIKRTREIDMLIEADINCFNLLVYIAYNTRLEEDFYIPPTIPVGWAKVDPNKIGLSLTTYRTTKRRLQEWGFAEFKSSNTGTIARVLLDFIKY